MPGVPPTSEMPDPSVMPTPYMAPYMGYSFDPSYGSMHPSTIAHPPGFMTHGSMMPGGMAPSAMAHEEFHGYPMMNGAMPPPTPETTVAVPEAPPLPEA